jgi:hypothetical protein
MIKEYKTNNQKREDLISEILIDSRGTRIEYKDYTIIQSEYFNFYSSKQKYKKMYRTRDSIESIKIFIDNVTNKKMEDNNQKQKYKVVFKETSSKFISKIDVGDIYQSTYGYNCTKQIFYVVTDLLDNGIKVIEINKQQVTRDTGYWQVIPTFPTSTYLKENVNNKIKARATHMFDNKLAFQIGTAKYGYRLYPWNGQPQTENDD